MAKKICLVGIIKNESKIIERMLSSVENTVDYVYLSDTGSDDNTIELIEKFLDEKKIPYHVDRNEFKNFGYNRQDNLHKAAKHFPDADYALLMDADLFFLEENFNKEELDKNKDKYYTTLGNKLKYSKIVLLSTNVEWECRMPTHEYWVRKDRKGGSYYHFKNDVIRDLGDGGCKKDKFTRDLRLLLGHLEYLKNPDKDDNVPPYELSRTNYYLSNTLNDLGRKDEAIEYKKKVTQDPHAALGEKYNCYLYIGDYYYDKYKDSNSPQLKSEHFMEALDNYLNCYKLRLNRSEEICKMGHMFNGIKAYKLAEIVSSFAKKPTQGELFANKNDYYNAISEDVVAKIYLKKYDEAAILIDAQLVSNETPPYYKNVFRNYEKYLPK